MVALVLIFLMGLLTFYAYTNHNNEFTATASAICEIWSGNCRLSCMQGEYSGNGGLSGNVKSQDQGTVSDLVRRRSSSPPVDCVCGSCPCSLLDNVFRTCRPATFMYNTCIESISNCYYEAVKTLYDNFKSKDGDEDCNVSSQKQVQMINQLDSSDNINFVNQTAVRIEKEKPKPVTQNNKSSANLKSLSKLKLAFRRKSDAEVLSKKTKDAVAPETEVPNVDMSARTSKCCSASDNSAISEQSGRSCSKCIEKGKTCIGNCPRAYEQGNKKQKRG